MTIEIGRYNTLEVLREVEHGVYLGGEEASDQVLLPRRYVPEGTQVGETLTVFVYTDSEDRPIATTLRPTAVAGDFAYLSVIDVSEHGGFLDWGLDKDLFAPANEQVRPLEIGDQFVFAVVLDATQRVKACSQLRSYFEYDVSGVRPGQEVDLLAYDRNAVGMLVVVDGKYTGIVYRNEAFQPMRVGQKLRGFVHRVREDNKLDVRLTRAGTDGIDDAQETILAALRADGGFLALHDKSSPESIRARLSMSKKAFKRALGGLYKARRVELLPGGVRSLDE